MFTSQLIQLKRNLKIHLSILFFPKIEKKKEKKAKDNLQSQFCRFLEWKLFNSVQGLKLNIDVDMLKDIKIEVKT